VTSVSARQASSDKQECPGHQTGPAKARNQVHARDGYGKAGDLEEIRHGDLESYTCAA